MEGRCWTLLQKSDRLSSTNWSLNAAVPPTRGASDVIPSQMDGSWHKLNFSVTAAGAICTVNESVLLWGSAPDKMLAEFISPFCPSAGRLVGLNQVVNKEGRLKAEGQIVHFLGRWLLSGFGLPSTLHFSAEQIPGKLVCETDRELEASLRVEGSLTHMRLPWVASGTPSLLGQGASLQSVCP